MLKLGEIDSHQRTRDFKGNPRNSDWYMVIDEEPVYAYIDESCTPICEVDDEEKEHYTSLASPYEIPESLIGKSDKPQVSPEACQSS